MQPGEQLDRCASQAQLDRCASQAGSAHPMGLEYPELPLTNNDAERALRHWIIARLISHGTRTDEGSLAFSILASVIETCRKRAASPWHYIAEVVRLRRKGLIAPALPGVVVN